MKFESFDFLYQPTSDILADLDYYVGTLGAEMVFAIERFGTKVAQLKLGGDRPRLMLAEHLEGEAPVLVFRVEDLEATLSELEAQGTTIEARSGIPHGPIATLRTPGGQRLAVYELTRPEADEHLAGRADFGPTSAGSAGR